MLSSPFNHFMYWRSIWQYDTWEKIMTTVKIVRIYMKELEHHVNKVLKILDEINVKHAIVLRDIEGGGHSAHILSLSP